MAGTTEKTFTVIIDADVSGFKQGLAQAKSEYSQLIAQMEKAANMASSIPQAQATTTGKSQKQPTTNAPSQRVSAEIIAANKAFETSVNEVTRSIKETSRAAARQTSRQAPPPGGGGGGTSSGGKFPEGGFLDSRARGDRSGGLLSRGKSVAEYAVSAMAVRQSFAALGKAGKTIVDVQKELQDLNKVLDVSQKQLLDFRKTATEVSKQYGVSITDTLKSYKIFAQMGLPTEEVKKYGRAVVQAKNVSEFDVEELAGLFSSASKAYGKELGGRPEKLTDALLAVEGKYAVTEKELGEVVKRIGPQASTLGISFHQLNALTTVMKERTRAPAEDIATSLRFITKGVMDPRVQEQVKKEIPTIKFATDSGDLRSAYDILSDIAEVYPTLTRRQQLSVAQSVAQTRHVSKFMGLMQGFGESNKIIQIGQSAQGTTMQRNAIVMESISKQAEKVGASFEAVAVSIGDGLTGPLMTALRITESILNTIEKVGNIKIPFTSQEGKEETTGTSLGAMAGTGLMMGAGMLAPRIVLGAKKGASAIGNLANLDNLLDGGAASTVAARTAQAARAFSTVEWGSSKYSISAPIRGAVTPAASAISTEVASVTKTIGPGLKAGISKAFSGIFNILSGQFLGRILTKAIAPVIGGGLGGPVGAIGGFLIQDYLNKMLLDKVGSYFASGKGRAEAGGVTGARAEAEQGVSFAEGLATSIKDYRNIGATLEDIKTMSPAEQAKAVEEGTLIGTSQDLQGKMEDTLKNLSSSISANFKHLQGIPGVNVGIGGKITYGKDVSGMPIDITKAGLSDKERESLRSRLEAQSPGASSADITAQLAAAEKQLTAERLNAIETLGAEISKRKTSSELVNRAAENMYLFGESLKKNITTDPQFKEFSEARDLYAKRLEKEQGTGISALSQTEHTMSFVNPSQWWDRLLGSKEEVKKYSFTSLEGMNPRQMQLLRDEQTSKTQSKLITGGMVESISNAYEAGAKTGDLSKGFAGVPGKELSEYVKNLGLEFIPLSKTLEEVLGSSPEKVGASTNKWRTGIGELAGTNPFTAALAYGSGFGQGDLRERNIEVGSQMQETARQIAILASMNVEFDQMKETVSKTSEDMTQGFESGKQKVEEMVTELNSAQPGNIIKYIDEKGRDAFGKVFRDISTGKLSVKLLESRVGAEISPRVGQLAPEQRLTRTMIKPLQDFANEISATGRLVSLSKAPMALGLTSQEVLGKTIRAGLGAGTSLDLKELDKKDLGASRINELTNAVAGTFSGYTKSGIPQFDKEQQVFLAQLEAFQKNVKEKKDEFEGGGKLAPEAFQALEKSKAQEEAGTLLAKAISDFGTTVKEFDSAVQKFQTYQTKAIAAEKINLAPSNHPLAKLGGEALSVWMPKTTREMSPMERAQAANPEMFRSLLDVQTQFTTMQDLLASSELKKQELFGAIEHASTGALQGISMENVEKLFSGVGIGGEDKENAIDIFNKLTASGGGSTESRQNLVEELKSILGAAFANTAKTYTDTAKGYSGTRDQLTMAAQAAVQLETLKKSADDAAEALQKVKKYGDLLSKEPVMRALGEGPLGRIGAEQPIVFSQEGKKGSPSQIDFSNMNKFEQEREMIRRLSSPEVRRGRTKILDENQVEMKAISEEEAAKRLRTVDIQESQYKKGLGEKRDKELATEYLKYGKDLSSSIDDLIKDNPNLSKNAKAGLQGQQSMIENIFNARTLLTPKGEINFDLLRPIEEVGKNIGEISKKEGVSLKDTKILDTVNQIMFGGSATDSNKEMLTKQSEANSYLSQIANNTASFGQQKGAFGGTSTQSTNQAVSGLLNQNISPEVNMSTLPQDNTESAYLNNIISGNLIPQSVPPGAAPIMSRMNPMYTAGPEEVTSSFTIGNKRLITPTGGMPEFRGKDSTWQSVSAALTGRDIDVKRPPIPTEQTGFSGMVPFADVGEKVTLGNQAPTIHAGMVPYEETSRDIKGGAVGGLGSERLFKSNLSSRPEPNVDKIASSVGSELKQGGSKDKSSIAEEGKGFQGAVKDAADYFKSMIASGADALKSALGNLTTGSGPGAKIGSTEELLKAMTELAKKQEEDKAVLEDKIAVIETSVSTENPAITQQKEEINAMLEKMKADTTSVVNSSLEKTQNTIETSIRSASELANRANTALNEISAKVNGLEPKLNQLEGRLSGTQQLAQQAMSIASSRR